MTRAIRVFEAIRTSGVDLPATHINQFGSHTNALRLFGREDHITKTLLDQQRERCIVCRSFGQPQCFRVTTKAKTKIRYAPNDLRQSIALVAQRQYRMTVSLSDRVAMTSAF